MSIGGVYIKPGYKIGRLTVRELAVDGNANQRRLLCYCECGGMKITSEDNLKRGHCKSCGCLYEKIGGKSKYGTLHGESKTRLYKIWSRMVWRCERPSYKYYADYGGRGIDVCAEWHNFEVFKEWAYKNGYDGTLTIDRIDNGKGYSPDNCRWATRKQQANNRRSNRKIYYNGEERNISEWADYFGIESGKFNAAIQRGRTIDEILERERKHGNLSA